MSILKTSWASKRPLMRTLMRDIMENDPTTFVKKLSSKISLGCITSTIPVVYSMEYSEES